MRFLVDAQLPPALARWLGERGFAATPVRERGLRDSDEGSIWNFATEGGWTVMTKDEDFVDRCVGNPTAPPVVSRELLEAWQKAAADAVRFTVDRMGTMADVKFLKPVAAPLSSR